MNPRLKELLGVLDLEEIELNVYRGQNEPGREGRLFGGQVAAQALVAARRTVGDVPAHSLHGYFLRPGDPAVPVLYTVDRIRDGRSFQTRRVVAVQRGKAIFNMACSFHAAEPGYEHQAPMPESPDPETLPTWAERVAENLDRLPEEVRAWAPRPRPIDMRHVHPPTFLGGKPEPGPTLSWFRIEQPLPADDPAHEAILTYVTDMGLVDSIVRHHGRKGPLGPVMVASLDHAVWFHQPPRVDDWLLYQQESPGAHGARGFARGMIFARDGTLVASVAQEGLVRPVGKQGKPEDRSQ
ncbi:MAG: acyl-CoA thioesterase II [Myxococcota bacterium]|nr:acyl-CoA thioesterase II [Myxococcota bacterium]